MIVRSCVCSVITNCERHLPLGGIELLDQSLDLVHLDVLLIGSAFTNVNHIC